MGMKLWSIQIAEKEAERARREAEEDMNMPALQDVSDDEASMSDFTDLSDSDSDDPLAVDFGSRRNDSPRRDRPFSMRAGFHRPATQAAQSSTAPTAVASSNQAGDASGSAIRARLLEEGRARGRVPVMSVEEAQTRLQRSGAALMRLIQERHARAQEPIVAPQMSLFRPPPPPQPADLFERDISAPALPRRAGFLVDMEYARRPLIPPPTTSLFRRNISAPAPQSSGGGSLVDTEYAGRQPPPPQERESPDEQ